MTPLNILVLAPQPFFQPRGTPIAVRALVEQLATEGHRIDLVVYSEGEDLAIPNCTVHRVPKLPGIRGIRPGFSIKKLVSDLVLGVKALRLMRRSRPDVVHAVEESAFIGMLGRRLYGIPFIYDMDSSLAQQLVEQLPYLVLLLPLFVLFERAVVRASAGTIVVCRALEHVARQHAPGSPIARVEDSSLLADDLSIVREPLPSAARRGPVAMYVGNLEPYQGIDLLLEGFQHALREEPDAQLVLIGGPAPAIAAYRARSNVLGIARNVHFLGPKPVALLGNYLRQADVLVSPRIRGVNTPMKLYSYLDSGVPVLATRLSMHTQVLDDAVALLADPVPEAVGTGLVALFRDPVARGELGIRGRRLARREFAAEAVAHRLRTFYEEISEQLQRPTSRGVPSNQPPNAA
jgi:glycosyltransferase involved in cell wall biosynthesis